MSADLGSPQQVVCPLCQRRDNNTGSCGIRRLARRGCSDRWRRSSHASKGPHCVL